MVSNRFFSSSVFIVCLALSVSLGFAQQNQPPLTNSDVTKMVKSGLPESTIVAAIRNSPTAFDVSPDALITLSKAGVTQSVLDTMISAGAAARKGGADTPVGAAPTGQLFAVLLNQGSQQRMPWQKSQLTQTKSKASSLHEFSSDGALNGSLRAGINDAAWEAYEHTGAAGDLGYTGISQAGSITSSVLARRKPTVSFVWALPGASSSYVVAAGTPKFEVDFGNIVGISSDYYEAALVRLTRTPNNWRLVGASQAKSDAVDGTTATWEVYSTFVEDRVPVQSQKLASGQVQIASTAPLAAGEYAVVLRPLSKNMKFSGADIARSRGEGLAFDSVWAFTVK